MLKIGIMSGASIVPRVVKGIKVSGVAEATAIACRSLDKAQRLAKDLDIKKAYGSYLELVDDPELDLIYIPLINFEHFSGAKMALEAGKHVLLEKPFTMTKKGAKELFDLSREKNVFLMEGQKEVFLPVIQKVKSELEAGKIGKIQNVEIRESRPGVETIPWFLDLAKGGGTLISNASYPLSILQYLFGISFDEFTGLHTTRDPMQADDECLLSFRKGKLLASLFISSLMKFKSCLTIHGSLGRIEIFDYWKTDEANIYLNSGEKERIKIPFESEFAYEIQHIDECITKGLNESPLVPSQMTLETVSTVESLYKQWYGQAWPII